MILQKQAQLGINGLKNRLILAKNVNLIGLKYVTIVETLF